MMSAKNDNNCIVYESDSNKNVQNVKKKPSFFSKSPSINTYSNNTPGMCLDK